MLVRPCVGERLDLPAVTFGLVDAAGTLSFGIGPGAALVTEHELLDQRELREYLSRLLGGVGIGVFATMPDAGLVAVTCGVPALHEVNRIGRLVVERLGGDVVLRELYGPLVLLAVTAGECSTSPLDEARTSRVRRAYACLVAGQTWSGDAQI